MKCFKSNAISKYLNLGAQSLLSLLRTSFLRCENPVQYEPSKFGGRPDIGMASREACTIGLMVNFGLREMGGNSLAPLYQWLFLVPVKGGIGGIVHPLIGSIYHLYTTYIYIYKLPSAGPHMLPIPPFTGTRNNH